MKSIIFTISSSKMLTIGDLLQAGIFECYSVSAIDLHMQPSESSSISEFKSVLFGVKKESSLGFNLSFDSQVYELSIDDLATVSDWTGALMFIRMLLSLLDVEICQNEGIEYNVDSILEFRYTSIFVAAISELSNLLKSNPLIELMGVRRPIYINELFLSQLLNVSDDKIITQYDRCLLFTQQLNAYYSEQEVFKLEQNGSDTYITVNYLNCEVPTILPVEPTLNMQYRMHNPNLNIYASYVFIMTSDGKKLAEAPYREFLQSLTEGIGMLDAKHMLVEPLSTRKLEKLLRK